MVCRSLLAFGVLAVALASAEDSLYTPDALSSCKTYRDINGVITCFSCPQDGCSVNFSGFGLADVACTCFCAGEELTCLSRAATAEEIQAINAEEAQDDYEYEYEYEYSDDDDDDDRR